MQLFSEVVVGSISHFYIAFQTQLLLGVNLKSLLHDIEEIICGG